MSRVARYIAVALIAFTGIALLVRSGVSDTGAPKTAAARGLMSARSGACAVMLSDGTMLITGGQANKATLATTELFSVRNGTTAGPNLTTARANHACAALPGGLVLVAGGTGPGGNALNSAEIYDPATQAFTPVATMMMARANATASVLPGGKALIVGGDVSGEPTNKLEVFDSATRSFQAIPEALSFSRTQHATVVLKNGKILVFGGWDGAKALDTIEAYDTSSGSVAVVGKMSVPRAGLSATVLLGGRVYLAGGTSNGKQELASTEIYNPQDGAVKPAAPLGAPRRGHLALLLPENNSVLVIGGSANGNLMAGAELYIPWWDKYKPLAALKVPQADGSLAFNFGAAIRSALSETVVKAATSDPSLFPVISTDKDDYSPGDTATITGAGWPAGATVNLHLDRDPVPDSTQYPDLVSDWTATVDGNGSFTTTYKVVQADLGVTFTLTAEVAGTNETAQILRTVTFTDGNVNVAGAVSGITFSVTATKYSSVTTCSGSAANGYPKTVTVTGTTAVNAGGVQDKDSIQLTAAPTASSGGSEFVKWTGPNSFTSTSATICVQGSQNGQLTYTANYGNADNVAPTSVASVTPIANSNGWNNTNPTVTINATDDTGGSGVKSITYSATGANPITSTTTSNSTDSFTIGADGTTTISYFATDNAGNNETAHIITIKLDKAPPTLQPPSIAPQEATGATGASVTYNVTATDAQTPSVAASCSPASGSMFAIGVSGVSCSATDLAGNTATGSFSITVRDTTSPVLQLPSNMTVEQTALGGNVVTYTATATDIVDGTDAVSCSPASGSTFPRGTTTVSCSSTDMHYNTATGSFTVTVVDTMPPTGTIKINDGAEYTKSTSVTLALTCADSGSGCFQMAFSDDGTTFSTPTAIGTSYVYTLPTGDGPKTVYVRYTDSAGNAVMVSANIGLDTTAPTSTLTFPGAGAYNADGWKASAGQCGVTNGDPNSGAMCGTAADAGTEASGVQKVEVSIQNALGVYWDPEANAFSAATEKLVAATLGTAANGTLPWTMPFNGSNFIDGFYTVHVHATDKAGNAQSDNIAAATFTIDTTAPTITASATVNKDPYTGAWTNQNVVVGFTCSDNGSGLADHNPPDATTVSTEGANQSVSGTCTDKAGNSASATFSNINIDKTAPTVTVPGNIVQEATGPSGAAVSYNASATDNLDSAPIVSCTPASGSMFAITSTPVNCTASDHAGNLSGAKTFTITVQDTTPPALHLPANIMVEQTAPGGNVVTYTATATDIVDGTDAVTCSPASGLTFPRGTTTVSCSSTDAHHNKATGSFTVSVVDTTPPTGTIKINDGTEYTKSTSVTLALTCADSGSGCFQMAFSGDGITFSTPTAIGTSYSYTLPTGDGQKTVYVQYVDFAGNKAVTSAKIGLDTAAPTSTLTFPATGLYNTAGWHYGTVACGLTNSDPNSGVLCGTAADAETGASGVHQVEVSVQNALGVYWDPEANAFSAATEKFVAATLGTVANGTLPWTVPFNRSNFADGSYTAHVRATDTAGNVQTDNIATATFTIDTTPPTITASATANGAPYTGAWTNQNVAVSFTCSDNGSGLADHNPPDATTVSTEAANQSVSGTCTDKAGNSATATFSNINIDKTSPGPTIATVAPLPNTAGWNNSSPVVSFSATDSLSGIASCTPAANIKAETAGTVVNGSCIDNAGNPGGVASVTVKLDMTAPTVTNVVANPVALGTPGTLTAAVNDPLSNNTQSGIASVQYTIDGGPPQAFTIAPSSVGSSTVNVNTALPSFSATGVHDVCVTSVDIAGNTSKPACGFYAVYDPNAGFVTGGGWIDSSAGACTGSIAACGTNATGKANFGFVSKYQKGANVPTGETEFDFKAGNLNFHSATYQWLVISGPMAQYKGTGTINGQGNYTFLLTARDGALNGGGGPDGFRIKIADPSGVVIYDNLNSGDDSMSSANVQVLGGGSIQIKSK